MTRQTVNNAKLGVFVVAGLFLLVVLLYMVGKEQSLFTSSFELKVRFRNVDGLTKGNNVRFAGIQSGTVKKIAIVNDTTIEVVLLIDEDIKGNIRNNSIAYIGSEGLMGNKVVNIVPNAALSPLVEEGDVLSTRKQADLNEALGTLYQTNDNVSVISQELIQTIRNINSSVMLRTLLNDTLLIADLRSSVGGLRSSSLHINNSSVYIEEAMQDMNEGRGVLGLLLRDEAMELKARESINDINFSSSRLRVLMMRIDSIAAALEVSVNDRDGLVYALLRDTTFAGRLGRSLDNVEEGTSAFSEDMEALKHNFLLRGYFRKQEKRKQKAERNDQ